MARSALTSSGYRTSEQLKVNDTLVNRRESKGAGNLIQLSGEVLPLDRSEIAIDGLRPEDHEVVSGGSWLKSVNAPPKKALLSFDVRHFSANIGRDDLYDAGITVSKSKCFPSVDKCNRTPATRNPFPIGK